MMRENIKRGLVFAAFLFTLIALVPNRWVSAWDGQNAAPAQAEEKTIDQTHKNIQVLKGVPDSQLRPIMQLFNASLGVNCAGCHAMKEGRMDFASDDNPHKQVARQMIKMVMEINKNNFNGRAQVSCYTCHQGKEHPVGVPPLPLTAPAPAGGGAAANAAPAGDAPNADQIVDKYVQAVGGKAAADKLKNSRMKGSMVMPNGQSSDLEVVVDGSSKLLVKTTTPQGAATSAFTGTGGWVKNSREQRAMNPTETAMAKGLLEDFNVIKLGEAMPKLTYAGRAKVGDRDAVALRGMQGNKRVRLLFDAQTGLLLRRVVTTDTVIGSTPVQTDYEDYREVDGVKVPMTIRTSAVDQSMAGTRKFTEVKYNVQVDATQFEAPAKP